MRKRLMKNLWLTFVSTVVIAIAISIFTATTATPRFYYSVTDLGTLDGNRFTSPFRINDLGQVVGQSSGTTPGGSAFLWQNGKMTNLGTLGGSNSVAFDINNSGQVVGNSLTSSGQTHAFVWQNGKMVQ